MEFMGIRFAPLNIPLERRLQTLSTFFAFNFFFFFVPFGISLTTYILFYTKYWFIAVAYLTWVWVIDKDTPECGARRRSFFCNWNSNQYARDYFPAKLHVEKGVKLDAKQNYLFAIFPHGVIPIGAFLTITSNSTQFNEIFPYHEVNGLTLSANFKIPIVRDIMLLMGTCSSSAKSISYLLSYPEGGRIAALAVGGAEEAFYARPGPYHVVLQNRKGFIKLALKNGSPLVPVFSFGEIEIFEQVNNPEGSLLRRCQNWFKRTTGMAPILFFGRGFLQYTFGFIPKRRPINVVMGAPIEVQRNDNPSQQDIDDLHSIFISKLKKLFDEHKDHYIENSEHAQLIIC